MTKPKAPKPIQKINFKVSVEIPAESESARLTPEERAATVYANMVGRLVPSRAYGAPRVTVTRTK